MIRPFENGHKSILKMGVGITARGLSEDGSDNEVKILLRVYLYPKSVRFWMCFDVMK